MAGRLQHTTRRNAYGYSEHIPDCCRLWRASIGCSVYTCGNQWRGILMLREVTMRRDHVLCELLLGLMFGLLANAVCMGQTIDTHTQRHDMHSCPLGQFVTGVHVNNNLLLCSSDFGDYPASEEIVDRNTQEQGMHACPEGMA